MGKAIFFCIKKLLRRDAFFPCAVVVAALVMAASILIHYNHRFFINLMGQHLQYIATDIASLVDADKHAQIKGPADISSDAYASVSRILEDQQKKKPNIKSIYTLRIIDGQVRFIVVPPTDLNGDGKIEGQLEERQAIGTPYNQAADPEMIGAIKGVSTAGNAFTKDRWGVWLSGCAPLRTSDGAVDAALCLDEDASPMREHIFFADSIVILVTVIIALVLMLSISGFLCASEESQKRTDAERAYENAISLFSETFEKSPLIAIQSMDRDANVLLWNRASEQFYGIAKEEAIGKNLAELLLSKSESAELKELIERTWTTRQPQHPHEWKITAKDGTQLTMLSTMFPIIVDGDVKEVFCMDIDVSAQKIVEADLKRQIDRFKDLQDRLLSREDRVIELKNEVNAVLRRLGEQPKYVV